MSAIASLLSLAVLILQSSLAFRGDLRLHLDKHLNDDVFYYLQWAWNVAHGRGATFDGLNATNGVQPLWALLLAGLAATGLDKSALIPWTLGLAALCNAGSLLALYFVTRQLVSPAVQAVALALWFSLQTRTLLVQSGMEVSLNAFACLLYLGALIRFLPQPSPQRAAWVGFAAGFAVLARVDNLLYVGVGALAAAWATRKALRRVAHALGFALPLAALVLPYFAWNLLSFGHLMPISGRIKTYSHFIDEVQLHGGYASTEYWALIPQRALDILHNVLQQFLPDALWEVTNRIPGDATTWGGTGLLVATLAALILRARHRRDGYGWVIGILALASIAHVGIIVFLVGKYTIYTKWYFVWQLALLTVLSAVVIETVLRGVAARSRRGSTALRVAYATGALLIVVRGLAVFDSLHTSMKWPYNPGNFLQVRHDVALWMRNQLPPEAIVASFNAGQLGYFSERRVINLDGLVNNDTLLQWHRQRKPLVAYLDSMQVDYIVDWEMADVAAGRRTFHHVPKDRLTLLAEWEVPEGESLERYFRAYRYRSGGEDVPFTPFLGAVEEYP